MRCRRPTRMSRIKTVLVFEKTDRAIAAVTPLTVWAFRSKSAHGLRIKGPVTLDHSLIAHWSTLVIPLANAMLKAIGITPCRFEVTVANPHLASARDAPAHISGYSADGAMLIGCFAAGAGMHISPHVAVSAHVASSAGDLGTVSSLDAKYAAAREDRAVTRFVYAATGENLRPLGAKPVGRMAASGALDHAEGFRAVAVHDLADLLEQVVDPFEIVHLGLAKGFFESEALPPSNDSPMARAVHFIADGNANRFWQLLEEALFAGNNGRLERLLRSFADYHVHRRVYPTQAGSKALQLLRSLSPTALHQRLTFPLLAIPLVLVVAGLAKDADGEDALDWIDAMTGRHRALGTATVPANPVKAADDAAAAVDYALSALSNTEINRSISVPLDDACVCFPLDSVSADSHVAFLQTIVAYYQHSIRRSMLVPIPSDPQMLAADAMRLAGDAFADQGGLQAAEAEARRGSHGGLRLVLARMTDRLKEEFTYKYVDRVLKEVVDPFNSNQKLEFTRALLQRLDQLLPEDVRARPVEDWVEHRDMLVKVVVQSLNRIHDTLNRV